MDHTNLLDYEHFVHTLRSVGAQMHHAQTVHTLLLDAWGTPYRKFHTLNYLAQCLHHLEQERWGGLIEGPERGRLALALWFADSICLPRVHDHEVQSAEWAFKSMTLLGISQSNIDSVIELILCTKPGSTIDSVRKSWMHDISSHALGAPYLEFVKLTRAWRDEWSWVDDLNYRRGLDILLKRYVHAATIFKTEAGQVDYENNANYNISQALQSLQNLDVFLKSQE